MKKIFFISMALVCAFTGMAQLSWLSKANYPGLGTHGVSSFSINNIGYMGLGFDSDFVHHTDWYSYNPTTDTWTAKASLPGMPRSNCVSMVINGKGYVITGQGIQGGGVFLKEVWEYDPVADTWTAKANLPGAGRMNAAGFSVGGKGYVGTGFIGGAVTSDFYEFDPVANTWTTKANVPGNNRNAAVAFNVGAKGYLGMGSEHNGVTNLTDFYEYDPTNDTWTQKAEYPFPAVNVPTTYSGTGTGYVLCGYYIQYSGITHNPLNLLFSYGPQSDAWTLEGTFWGAPRGFAGGFALNNDIYIGAGGGGSGTSPVKGPFHRDLWKLTNGLSLMISPVENNTDFKIFPNPAGDVIYIDPSLTGKMKAVRIYNMEGRFIKEHQPGSDFEAIDISTVASGVYFVEAITKTGDVLDSRFVKE